MNYPRFCLHMGHCKLSRPQLWVLRKATHLLHVPVYAIAHWAEHQKTSALVHKPTGEDDLTFSLGLSFSVCKGRAGLLASRYDSFQPYLYWK